MAGSRPQPRPAPSVLLIGLILLVASHLVGALHGPGFLGPHKPLTTANVVLSTAPAEPLAFGPEHGHDHDVFEDTVEHAVDRVRVSADRPVHDPELVEPVVDRPGMSPSPGRAVPGDGVPVQGVGRSACARHCVWRQ